MKYLLSIMLYNVHIEYRCSNFKTDNNSILLTGGKCNRLTGKLRQKQIYRRAIDKSSSCVRKIKVASHLEQAFSASFREVRVKINENCCRKQFKRMPSTQKPSYASTKLSVIRVWKLNRPSVNHVDTVAEIVLHNSEVGHVSFAPRGLTIEGCLKEFPVSSCTRSTVRIRPKHKQPGKCYASVECYAFRAAVFPAGAHAPQK